MTGGGSGRTVQLCAEEGEQVMDMAGGVSANHVHGFERFILQNLQRDHVKKTFS
jgi:hypothetical protein